MAENKDNLKPIVISKDDFGKKEKDKGKDIEKYRKDMLRECLIINKRRYCDISIIWKFTSLILGYILIFMLAYVKIINVSLYIENLIGYGFKDKKAINYYIGFMIIGIGIILWKLPQFIYDIIYYFSNNTIDDKNNRTK